MFELILLAMSIGMYVVVADDREGDRHGLAGILLGLLLTMLCFVVLSLMS